MVNTENEKILIITVGLVISVLGGVYLYTQNTGIKACLNLGAEQQGYKSWKDLIERQNDVEAGSYSQIRSQMSSGTILNQCAED